MSVIFEKMQMPAGCAVCRFEDAGECVALGTAVGCYRKLTDKRFPLCPLTELPPHGDLIDRDALRPFDRLFDSSKNESGVWVRFREVVWMLRSAPVVIAGEAER